MENALDHSRRRLHRRPEPSTPAVLRLTTVLLFIIWQSGRGLELTRRAFPRSFAYPSHAQLSHLLRCLARALADPGATPPGRDRRSTRRWDRPAGQGCSCGQRLTEPLRAGGRRTFGSGRDPSGRPHPQLGRDAHRPRWSHTVAAPNRAAGRPRVPPTARGPDNRRPRRAGESSGQ
jgi:hypothetical protein